MIRTYKVQFTVGDDVSAPATFHTLDAIEAAVRKEQRAQPTETVAAYIREPGASPYSGYAELKPGGRYELTFSSGA